MKIAFIDLALWDYSIESVKEMPLGGSQSALCYLAINFAQLGHDVFLLNSIECPTISCGVGCLPINSVSTKFWSKVDVIIFLNCADCGKEFRELHNTQTQLILWSGHAENQPAIQGLLEDEERNAYDSFVLISEWQKSSYIKKFNLNPDNQQSAGL
jgi:predicted metal-binding protein